MIDLSREGALLEDRLSLEDPVFGNSDILCLIDTMECESQDSFPQTVRELARFVSRVEPSPAVDYVEKDMAKRYRLTMEINAGFQLDALLQHVSAKSLAGKNSYFVSFHSE